MWVRIVLVLLLVTNAKTLFGQTGRITGLRECCFKLTWSNLAQAISASESNTPQNKAVTDQSKTSASEESSVSPEDPVITLHGVCANSGDPNRQKDESCKTVVSRREFEFLSNSINLSGKPIPMGSRQNLAKTYAQYLVYEPPAKQAGLENTERYAEIMRWLRLRMLTDLLREKIVEEYRTPSDAEVTRYYEEHVADFDRVHVARIMIPRTLPLAGDEKTGGEKQKQDRDNKLLTAANDARQRAVKGDDPEQIQKEVYQALGIGAPPPTDLGKQGRKDFLADESVELFALKAGDVSAVEKETASYVIYRVIARETLAENQVKEQISREIARRNIDRANQAITQPVQPEYNEKYFGPPVVDAPAAGMPAHP